MYHYFSNIISRFEIGKDDFVVLDGFVLEEGNVIVYNKLQLIIPDGFNKKLNSMEKHQLLVDELYANGFKMANSVTDGSGDVILRNSAKDREKYIPLRKRHDISKRLREYLELLDKQAGNEVMEYVNSLFEKFHDGMGFHIPEAWNGIPTDISIGDVVSLGDVWNGESELNWNDDDTPGEYIGSCAWYLPSEEEDILDITFKLLKHLKSGEYPNIIGCEYDVNGNPINPNITREDKVEVLKMEII